MVPSAAEIVTGRWRMAAWLRVLALVGMFAAVPALISWLGEGLRDDDLWNHHYYTGRMTLGAGGLIIASTLFVLAPVLARVLLPVPLATECPRCHYALSGAGGGRCPECGLPVGEAFIGSAIEAGPRRRRSGSRLLDEIAPATFLLGAVWSVILAGVVFVSLISVMGFGGLIAAALVSGPILVSQVLALRMASRGTGGRQRGEAAAPIDAPAAD